MRRMYECKSLCAASVTSWPSGTAKAAVNAATNNKKNRSRPVSHCGVFVLLPADISVDDVTDPSSMWLFRLIRGLHSLFSNQQAFELITTAGQIPTRPNLKQMARVAKISTSPPPYANSQQEAQFYDPATSRADEDGIFGTLYFSTVIARLSLHQFKENMSNRNMILLDMGGICTSNCDRQINSFGNCRFQTAKACYRIASSSRSA